MQTTGCVVVVVVTGAAGFVGRRLVARLTREGHRVVGIDRRPGRLPGIAHLRADLADAPLDPAVTHLLQLADAVFHLAASPGVRASGGDVAMRRWRDNVLAGEAVLTTVPDDVPIIVTSTSAVYGGTTMVDGMLRPSTEDDAVRPRGGYARSKVVLEDMCAARRMRGGRVAVVRPFTVAGPGQRHDMAISQWVAAAGRGDPLTVYGSAARSRDITDVDDLVEVLLRTWQRGVDTTLNAGTGRPVTIARLIEVVAAVLDVAVVTRVVAADDAEVTHTRACTRRCSELLDVVPQTDLYGVVRRQIDAARRPIGARA